MEVKLHYYDKAAVTLRSKYLHITATECVLYAILCCVMLCSALLSSAQLRHAMPCYTILHYIKNALYSTPRYYTIRCYTLLYSTLLYTTLQNTLLRALKGGLVDLGFVHHFPGAGFCVGMLHLGCYRGLEGPLSICIQNRYLNIYLHSCIVSYTYMHVYAYSPVHVHA